MEAEKLGIPSVVVTTTGFTGLAKATGRVAGIADLRTAEYPGPVGIHDPKQIRENVVQVLVERVTDALRRAPGDIAKDGGQRSNPKEPVFEGTLEEVNGYFSVQNWTDSLPILPPVTEKIQKFVEYSGRDPDERIALLAPANLKATPWNIAVNAIMAGCQARDMPLLIATVEALGDEKFNLANIGSTSGLVPFLLVNGPIVRELGIQTGGQLISRSPNATIGRAVGLIIKNIAGYVPGTTYMGTFGYPLPFVLAEDERATPWAPFHVDQGFSENASTVTVGITNNWGPATSPHSSRDRSGADVALEVLTKEILSKKIRLAYFAERGPEARKAMVTLVLSPSVARSIADAGYSKQQVKQYLVDNTRMTLAEFKWICKYTTHWGDDVQERAKAGVFSEEFLGSPEQLVHVLSGPDIVHVIVCGDANRNRVMCFEGGHSQPTTRQIRMPACHEG